MQIDWLTVAAQIVNFLVLVWLLQRFLYKPITDAMRRREKRIEERLTDAKSAREKAEEEERHLKQAQAELEDKKEGILDATRKEADEMRQTLEADIRAEMEERRAAWRDHLAQERDAFTASLRRKAGRKVIEISQRILSDYTGTDLSERVIAVFVERLRALDPDTRAKMTEAAATQGARATVHSGRAIESAVQGRITRAIHEILSTDIDVTYQEDREMVLGARLTIGDYTAEWSAVRYLERLDAELGDIIDAGSGVKTGARDTPENEERETA